MYVSMVEEILGIVQEAEKRFLTYYNKNTPQNTLKRTLLGFALVKAGLVEAREHKCKEEE